MTQEKLALLSCIKTLKQEVIRQFESLEERVIALEDSQQTFTQIQPTNNEWLTAKELARHFKVSPGTIYDWAEKGTIPVGTPFGVRQTRWKLSDVEARLRPLQAEETLNLVTVAKRRGRPSKIRRKEEFYV